MVEQTVALLRMIGSPFRAPDNSQRAVESRELYEYAFKNRVDLLYLRELKRRGLLSQLAREHKRLEQRACETTITASRVAEVLSEAQIPYVLFKTLRSYPSTPNDVDVVFLGPGGRFEQAKEALRTAGYLEHPDAAPLQVLFVDPRGAEVANWDKKGGMYYVDLYQEASADYIVYLRKTELRKNVTTACLDGHITAKVLRPQTELAALMIHSVFPENTYALEMFYTVCYTLVDLRAEQVEEFVSFVRRNRLVIPAVANLSLTAALHDVAFGTEPDEISELVQQLGGPYDSEVKRLRATGYSLPHKYSTQVFLGSVLAKLLDKRFLCSFGVQACHMLRPAFARDTLNTLRRKLTQETYVHV